MTFREFGVQTPDIGEVDVVKQFDGESYFWDLFNDAGDCLNEGNPFWTKPTKKEVLDFLKQ